MFEDLFGYAPKDSPKPPIATKPETPVKPPKRPKGNTTPEVSPEAVERAARAVRNALATSKRRRPTKVWRPLVKDALGVSYLKASWWKSVIDRGIAMGLFKLEEKTLTFPYLIALDEPEPVPEEDPEETTPTPIPAGPCMSQAEWDVFVAEEKAKSILPEGFGPEFPKTPPLYKPTPLPHPNDRRYQYHLACGHYSGALKRRTLEDGTEEIFCQGCDSQTRTPADHQWMSINRGVPMPKKRRRSEKNPTGDCCNEDGQYIGGLEGMMKRLMCCHRRWAQLVRRRERPAIALL